MGGEQLADLPHDPEGLTHVEQAGFNDAFGGHVVHHGPVGTNDHPHVLQLFVERVEPPFGTPGHEHHVNPGIPCGGNGLDGARPEAKIGSQNRPVQIARDHSDGLVGFLLETSAHHWSVT